MGDTQVIILYLLLFRMAVVGAGVISIVLGYRLFIHGSQILSSGEGDGEIGVKVGVAQFSLKKVAPGTCFALFGAGLIVAMLIKAPPEVTVSDTGEVYRGTEVEPINSPWKSLQLGDDTTPADIELFWRNNAVSLNDMAWFLYEQNSYLELAESLVQVSIASDSQGQNKAAYIDTQDKIRKRLADD